MCYCNYVQSTNKAEYAHGGDEQANLPSIQHKGSNTRRDTKLEANRREKAECKYRAYKEVKLEGTKL